LNLRARHHPKPHKDQVLAASVFSDSLAFTPPCDVIVRIGVETKIASLCVFNACSSGHNSLLIRKVLIGGRSLQMLIDCGATECVVKPGVPRQFWLSGGSHGAWV
jgi:hypothetical protein